LSEPNVTHAPQDPAQDSAATRGTAVALAYQEGRDRAPRVVAKGYGQTADTIIASAREHGVYVHNSPALVNLLMQVDLDAHIPPALYLAVAELLAWLYQLDAAVPAAAPSGNATHPAPPLKPLIGGLF
jgi:flagellar biosynthesis protein